jgi:hypothetical protein
MEDKTFLRQHVVPILAGIMMAFMGGLFAVFLFPSVKLLILHGVFILAGTIVGLLTPRSKVDHRGTNGITLLIISWLGYMLFSSQLFTQTASISGWMFSLMLNNIINGFLIILGLWFGSVLQQRVNFTTLPWLAYMNPDRPLNDSDWVKVQKSDEHP